MHSFTFKSRASPGSAKADFLLFVERTQTLADCRRFTVTFSKTF
jgi:hypothetical protein